MDAESASKRILASLRKVPAGRVTSYGRLAEAAGIPRGARQAVAALKTPPENETIAWHRVLRSDGRIAFPADHPNHAIQTRILKGEGVIVRNGKVDLKRYLWREDAPDLLLPPD